MSAPASGAASGRSHPSIVAAPADPARDGGLAELRLVLLFAAGGVVCLLLGMVVSLLDKPQRRERAAVQRQAADAVQRRAARHIAAFATRLQSTVQKGAFATAELEALRESVRSLVQLSPEVLELMVVDKDDTVLASSDAGHQGKTLASTQLGVMVRRLLERGEAEPLEDLAQQQITLLAPLGRPATAVLILVETTSDLEEALSHGVLVRAPRVPIWLTVGLGLLGLLAALGLALAERRQHQEAAQRVTEQADRLLAEQYDLLLDPQDVPSLMALAERVNALGARMYALQVAQMEGSMHATRIAQELHSAQVVQQTLMPDVRRVVLGSLQLCGVYRSVSRLSGDWWHHYPLDDHRTLLVLADVVGHGIGPAVVGAMAFGCTVELLRELGAAIKPQILLNRLNQAIWSTTRGKFSMSCFAAILDTQASQITYASGAHAFPLLFRPRDAQKPFLPLVVPGVQVGSAEATEFAENVQPFEPGDMLICYTDGLTEAQNSAGEPFGDKRVRQTVQKNAGRNVEEICELLLSEVSRFLGSAELEDDQTLVVAKM